MPPMNLNPVEQNLCRRVAHGEHFDLKPDQIIDAEVLRHILLGLPLIKKSARVWRVLARGRPTCGDLVCPRTAVGISISGGTIKGRLKLDSAGSEGGGPLCPLHFN